MERNQTIVVYQIVGVVVVLLSLSCYCGALTSLIWGAGVKRDREFMLSQVISFSQKSLGFSELIGMTKIYS